MLAQLCVQQLLLRAAQLQRSLHWMRTRPALEAGALVHLVVRHDFVATWARRVSVQGLSANAELERCELAGAPVISAPMLSPQKCSVTNPAAAGVKQAQL